MHVSSHNTHQLRIHSTVSYMMATWPDRGFIFIPGICVSMKPLQTAQKRRGEVFIVHQNIDRCIKG